MSKFSVRKPMTVFVAVVAILVLGFVAYTRMTPNLLPDLDLPYVMIITTYPGATPEQVESEVTKPIEQSMATLNNIEQVTSTSSENYSMVVLEFSSDVDMNSISVDISQSIDMLEGSWDDLVGSPYILKLNPDMLPVVIAAVDMEGMDTIEISQFIEDTLLTEVEGISGVASVSSSGIIEEKVNVLFSQDKIDELNDKIVSGINGEFSETESELNDAIDELEKQQSEIDSGTSQVEQGQNELANQSGSASSTITGKQAEIADAKVQIKEKISELETQLTELKTMQESLTQTQATITELENNKNLIQSEISNLQAIQSTIDTLTSAKTAIDNQIAAIESNSSMTDSEKEKAISEIRGSQEYLEIESGLAVIDAQLAARGLTRDSIPAGVESANETLAVIDSALASIDSALADMGLTRSDVASSLEEVSSGISQIEDGISTLNTTLSGVNSGAIQLSDALAELEKQKISAIFKLSDTSTKLTVGNSALSSYLSEAESGLEQVEDAKEAAYKSADLNGIVTLETISSILAAQNFSMPVGYVEEDSTKYMVSVGDTIKDTDEIGNLMLFDLGIDGVNPIYLSDVADIFISDNSDEVYAKINSNNGVILSINKQSTYATAGVSDSIWAKFDELSEEYEGLTFTNLMDQGEYIYLIIDSIMENLLLGALFAVIILLIFLKDIKPTIITLVAIPISVLLAIVLMYFSGVTINMFSLSGLAVAVGMLVDNSIVVIENIYRLRNLGESPIKSAISGATQVAGAVIASTLTTVCVFMPIVFVDGITKQLFTDFALTFAYALLASLFISLTLVPAMASGMLKKTKESKPGLLDKGIGVYSKSLNWALKHRKTVLAGAAALLVISAALSISRGFSFMPSMTTNQLSGTLEMPENSKFEDTVEMSDKAIELIKGVEGVDTVGAMLASSTSTLAVSSMDSSSSTDSVTLYIILNEDTKRAGSDIIDEIETLTADLDCEITVSSSSSMDMSALSGSGITVNVYSDDLDDLQVAAKNVAKKLETLEGVSEVSDGLEENDPTIKVTVDKNKAMAEGLTVAQVYAELASAITTESTATTIEYDGKDYEVVVNSGDEDERNPDFIRNYVFTVTDKEGEEKEIRLADIADIKDSESLSAIGRMDQKRYLTVTATVADGYNVTKVSSVAANRLSSVELPDDVSYEISGESETIMEAIVELLKMLALGVLLVYLVMVAQFQSLKSPFIVMFTIPLAFTGGFLALFLAGMDVSVISIIGFVMLVGIIVNNGIVLVDYINQLRMEGVSIMDAVKEAGVTRMRPVLMTSLTTVFGLIFTAIGTGQGSEMMKPIAIVCIGGLVYATLMTLYIVPVLYSLFNRKEMRIIKEEDLTMSEK